MTAESTGAPLDVLVIGGGQAGLAMGYHLTQSGRRFQIVDAGPEIGHVWRSRWDSLRLFTSESYDTLPGLPFPAVPSGYPGKDDVAAIYIGFGVADGRRTVLAVEISVATVFIVTAAAAVTGTPWLLVAGLAGHGLKDLWQHHTHYVANTRWWPPFCATVDFVVGGES
jgi:cation diffusion facilitator CzcD-associated flavoprotein CzcO